MNKILTKTDRFKGCIIGGAIGDAYGSGYENLKSGDNKQDGEIFYLFTQSSNKPKEKSPNWQITDDTQLTLATIEAMILSKNLNPKTFADNYLKLYKQRKLKGLGASTLKALRELEVGGHWSLVGRKGEYAAGNGAAMRIAPLAFSEALTRRKLKDICSITHQNDEAYVGCLCVINSIKAILNGTWQGKENLIEILVAQTPDTRTRDRLIEIKKLRKSRNLKEIGKLGNDGYVVNSVPLAIAAANQIDAKDIDEIFKELIEIGGDTDTNCSIAGQIIGSLIGINGIPIKMKDKLSKLQEYKWINRTVDKFIEDQEW